MLAARGGAPRRKTLSIESIAGNPGAEGDVTTVLLLSAQPSRYSSRAFPARINPAASAASMPVSMPFSTSSPSMAATACLPSLALV